MLINENVILNDIRAMLSQSYPLTDIEMTTYLEFGEGPSLDMSSLEIVQFIVDIEKKYNIIIDIDDRYYTVGDVVQGIIGYLEEKNECGA